MMNRSPHVKLSFLGAGILIVLFLLTAAGLAYAQDSSQQEGSILWSPDSRANTDNTNYSQHEPSLAISRTDPNIVVVTAKDYRINDNKEVWIYVSQDGGLTWPEELQLQIPGMPVDIPNQSDPVALARDDGRIYVFALGHNNGHGLFVTWSDDGGLTWQDPSVAITYNETPGELDDKEWPAIDNNPASPYYHNLYVAWATNGIQFKRSTDGGLTWSSPYQTIAPGDTEYPYPVVAPDGTLYVFYMDGWGYCADGHIRYMKSINGGVSFTGPYTVVPTSQPCSPIHGRGGYDQWRFFSIITAAADPTDPDNLWVAWTDDNGITNGKTDVLYVRSTDGGTSWSSPERLSHDAPDAYVDHITPVFAMSAEGRLHAFWLDRRADPNNRLFHGYHTSTLDGVTWEVDTQVSDEPFDLNLFFPPPPGYNAAGDYWGLDTVGSVVIAAWNTTVEDSQDIYVSRRIYTGTVSLSGYVSDVLTAAPITGAQVSLDTGQAVTTDPSGYYTMTLGTGVYTLTIQAETYYSETLTNRLIVMDTVRDINLQPLPVDLSGQVVNALSLEPISATQVSLDSGQAAFTDPDGFYTLTITPGIYTVTAQAAGFFSQTVSGLEVFSDTVQDFSLQPLPVSLSGQVVDALTLVLISGAEVLADSESALSGPDGTYHLELTPGVYTITVQAGGYYSQTISALSVLTDTIQDFALQPVACPPPEILGVGYTAEGLTVTFTATVTSTLPLEYGWDFGDGLTSTLPGPVHNYAGYGDYQVTLDVQNACGSASGSLELALGRRSYLPIMTRP